MRRQDMSVDQIQATFKKRQEECADFVSRYQETEQALMEELYLRAKLQQYTEEQFNALIQVAKEGIDLVTRLDIGSVADSEWIDKRNELVERAQRIIYVED